MNILVYDIAASSRGALSVLEDFYRQVSSEKEHTWHFVVSLPRLPEKENIRIHRYPWVKKNPLFRVFFDLFYIHGVIRRCKIDRIVSLQNVMVTNCRLPQVVVLHNALPFHRCDRSVLSSTVGILKQRVINRRIMKSLVAAERVIIPNEWMYRSCIGVPGVKASKVVMVKPNMEVPECVSKFKGFEGSAPRFFYPANAEPYKRHDLIFDACEILNGRGVSGYQVLFTLTGNENRHLMRLKGKSSVPDRFCFGGALSRERVFQEYGRSVLLFPSEIETDALPIIEAMMCGDFIIATETEFAKCILRDYPDKILIPRNAPEALADAMHKVILGDFTISGGGAVDFNAWSKAGDIVDAVLGRDIG